MASLHQIRQDVRHLSLLGGDVALQVAVEREKQQAVRTHYPGDEVHHQHLYLAVGVAEENKNSQNFEIANGV